jgi:tetratricopeptide (TPR) repeat protein
VDSLALSHTVIAIDIVGSSAGGRDRQVHLDQGLALALDEALAAVEHFPYPIRPAFRRVDGDSATIAVSASSPKASVVADFVLRELRLSVAKVNRPLNEAHRLRLRVAVDHGEALVHPDHIGGDPVIAAARLLDARQLRASVAASTDDIALIVSDRMFRDVISQRERGLDPDEYRAVKVSVKNFRERGWIHVPGRAAGHPPSRRGAPKWTTLRSSATSVPAVLRGRSSAPRSLMPETDRNSPEQTDRPPELAPVSGHISSDDIDVFPSRGRAADGGRATAPHRQLPTDIAEFTGRETELRKLRQLVSTGSPTAVVISAIEGMAGVGKTRLAVHAAHQLADRYDDVQLWSDLRGFDPNDQPASPAAVLESFLRLLGVAGSEIPYDLQERAALYRDKLAGKRALVLLDNAASEEQVRPLLPGSSTCLVLITSRRSLIGLDGAHPLSLDVFAPEEAVALLGRIAGHDRIAAESEAAARVAELCGHLPIAVSLAAKRLRSRPQWTLADLAARLGRLSTVEGAVNTVFNLSYQALPDEQQRVFRLLGLHPGDDFTPDSGAALTGLGSSEVEDRLEELLDEHLLQQHTPGRYRFHDLLRAYAVEQAVLDPAADRHEAVRRVLDWYLHSAKNADTHLNSQRRVEFGLIASLVKPRTFADHHAALTWCDTERANLVAGVSYAAEHNLPAHAWTLTQVLWDFFNLRKHWLDWISTHEISLEAARGVGDQVAEGRTLITLAIGLRELQRFDEAFECYRESLAIWRSVGDREREEVTLNNMGIAYFSLERFDQALRCYRESLTIARALGKRHSEGVTLNNIGLVHVELGQFDRAEQCYREALVIRAEIDDPYSTGIVLNNLGEVYRAMLRFPSAVAEISRALETFRRIGDRFGTAEALLNLGHALLGIDDREGAEKCWQEAALVFEELGDARVDEVRALAKISS